MQSHHKMILNQRIKLSFALCILFSNASNSLAEYIKVSNDGSALPMSTGYGVSGDDWACVYDTETHLIWEVKTTYGLHGTHLSFIWLNNNPANNGGFAGYVNGDNCDNAICDTENFLNYINTNQSLARFCGANDWRLPTLDELSSVNFNDPLLMSNHIGDMTKGYWTSTTATDPERAYLKLPVNNQIGDGHKSDQHGILMVRNGPDFKPINFKEAATKVENWSFEQRISIILAPDESLWVADNAHHHIVNLKQDGSVIWSFGDFSQRENALLFMAVAPDGSLYVDDSGNKRIQRFKADGTLLSTFNKPIDSPLLDMVFTTDGGFIALSTNYAQQFKADGSVSWTFKYGEPFTLPSSPYFFTRGLERVIIAADGTVYLLGVGTNVGTMVTRTFSLIHLTADGTLIDETPACCANDYAGKITFPSRDVVTTTGVKYTLQDYFDHTNIQKTSPNIPEYVYSSQTGALIFENITAGNAHYWVQLQEQTNIQFKVIKVYPIKPEIDYKTSVYDPETGLVTLPKVKVDGVNYQVIMQRLDNGLFGVKSAELLPK